MDRHKMSQNIARSQSERRASRTVSIEIVAARAGVSTQRVQYFEREGIVQSVKATDPAPRFDESAIQRITQCERLMNDLGVNLAGAEVILNMRERMILLIEELEQLRNQG